MHDASPITSAANPRIKAAVKLRKSRDRRNAGVFLAEGPREVSRAIAAGLKLMEVFYCPEVMADYDTKAALYGMDERTPTFTVTKALIKMLAYRDEPEGLIAVVNQPTWDLDDLPVPEVQANGGGAPLYLVAVGTQKPGNLGAMVRTAEAAGCKAVLACGESVDAFNPNAIRASTCAVFNLPVIQMSDEQAVAFLRDQHIRIAATTPAPDATLYTDADLAGPLALVIGPEDTGLSNDWLDAADLRLVIPTLGRTVDSLNAANAAAVLLFEAVRQREPRG